MEDKKRGNPLWNLLKEEWKHLGNRRNKFLLQLAIFTIAGIITLMTPLVIGLIFNSIQESLTSIEELKHLIFLISLLLAITIGFWIFHGLGRIMEQITGFFVHRNYTNSKIKKVLELPVSWHKDHHSGETIDKIDRSRGSIESFSQHFIFDIVYAFINIFGSLIILFFVDVKIALFAFVFSLTTLTIMMKIDNRLNKHYEELNKFSNKLSEAIYDYISNIFTIITLRLKRAVSSEVDSRIMASYKTHKKSVYLQELKWGFASIALSLMTVLVLIYKTYTDYSTTGIILIGTLYILYGYLNTVGNTFFSFAYLYGSIVSNNARVKGAKTLDDEFEKLKPSASGKLPSNWNKIGLKNIDFKYDEGENLRHIDDVSMSINRGQKIALVGESGSGKSTILSIMGGFYEPLKGTVICDNSKVKDGFEKLKNHVTLIPQDPEIFNNTIKYNITMDLKTENKDIQEVIHMARLKKVVSRLKKGLNTSVLEKGVSLSGGEKQRLALARGFLAAKNSEIVLLDEPTSSVDNLNEIEIYKQIFTKFKNKTIISSVHRLHLLDRFDYIYMFEKGKIVAEGTLKDIKKSPKFMHVWRKYGLTKEIK